MRAVALLVWVFLNAVFLIMCGYIYLIWSTYQSRPSIEIYSRRSYNPKDLVIFYKSNDTLKRKRFVDVAERGRSKPRIKLNGPLEKEVKSRVETIKDEVLLQLRRTLHDESSVFRADNPYGVQYKGYRLGSEPKKKELLCELKSAGLRTLTRTDPPFDKLPFDQLLGDGLIAENGKFFNSCAIVSSAASLLYSSSGLAIGLFASSAQSSRSVQGGAFALQKVSHDLVMRFNHAPTEDFEIDVGAKTHIRIVNSQVVTKEEFQFASNPLFKNVTIVVWDPSQYSASLLDWFNKPDFNFFTSWMNHKKTNPEGTSAILDPRSVWRVWNYLQNVTSLRIRRNPPSSGFLGLTLVLPLCNYVDFFEYVPSERMTSMCHYFDDLEDASCTLGVWHPLAAEKLIAYEMNEASDDDVFEKGFIRIPGFRNLNC